MGAAQKLLSQFLICKRGNFAIATAALAPALLAAAGLAVDYVNLSSAKAELQNSVDAAVIAVSRKDVAANDRSAVFGQILRAQLASNGYITLVDQDVDQTVGVNFIRTDARATASVPLMFMGKLMPNKVSVAA